MLYLIPEGKGGRLAGRAAPKKKFWYPLIAVAIKLLRFSEFSEKIFAES
jgi:hypothetical protein